MKTIYVMFSTTHTGAGSLIRKVTGFKYNHVSIGFDPQSDIWYSFARVNRALPLTGGFVKESHYRLCDGGDISVCVCACKVSNAQYRRIRDTIAYFSQEANSAYNYLAAALTPVNLYVYTPDTFTCISFVAHCLQRKTVSIEQLYYELSDDIVYVGSYMNLTSKYQQNPDFQYFCHLGKLYTLKMVLCNWHMLLHRYAYYTSISYRR